MKRAAGDQPADREVTDAKKKSKWWWFIVQCDTDEEALAWNPPAVPAIAYACWRPHAAPTTGKPHVHCLVNYKTAQAFKYMQKKGYSNLKFCGNNKKYQVSCREYCISDTKNKKGKEINKGPLGPFKEQGDWTGGSQSGDRNDLAEAGEAIMQKKSWKEVLHDKELMPTVARYTKWSREMYDNRPVEIEPVELEAGLQPWQETLTNYLREEPKRRRIFWVWSREHDTGKSTFKDYLDSLEMDILPGTLELHNLLAAYDRHKIVWFDQAKTNTGQNSVNYETLRNHVLEKMSNHGWQLSTKFNVVKKYVKCHVVVTSNDPPPHDALPKRLVEIYCTPLPGRDQEEELAPEPTPAPAPAPPLPPAPGYPSPPAYSDDEDIPTQVYFSSSEAEDEE